MMIYEMTYSNRGATWNQSSLICTFNRTRMFIARLSCLNTNKARFDQFNPII